MVNINAKEIKRMPLPLPPLKEQQVLIERMKDAAPIVDELIGTLNGVEIQGLSKAILHKAFAGEL